MTMASWPTIVDKGFKINGSNHAPKEVDMQRSL